ncbi:hydrolase [Tissierella creatinini]|nr:hydrolase [Tissierella creatinini]TJX67269.1 hydrolase [Soehngenia saccharolytica]
MEKEKYIPEVKSQLRSRSVQVPEVIYKASGIKILGIRIKSLLFSTDVAIIKNNNANSIIAVYPFTPQLSIIQSILEVAPVPVFAGVGGGLTTGKRAVAIALQAELLGAYGVVINAPTALDVIEDMRNAIDIPIISTIASLKDDYRAKLNAGVSILNVSGGANTANIVRKIRSEYGKELPIIATGGPTDETILETIDAGANAITYTPPTSAEIFAQVMKNYRGED